MRKYLSFTEAWRRINAAMEGEFYFEVVTLCESIISDRLLSYVRGVKTNSTAGITTPFGTLIQEWRSLAGKNLPIHGSSDLGFAVDAWRVERNAIIHGFAKSMPETETEPVESFIKRAETAATNGVLLAKAVSHWQKQKLRAHNRAKPS